MSETFDVAVIGAGPAGSACAAFCARAGLKTVLIEKAHFPREKVCGDCLNPGCWPILDRLHVTDRVRAAPHAALAEVEFITIGGRTIRLPLPGSGGGECAIKRSALDALLLERAREWGAEIRLGAPVTAIERGWNLYVEETRISARTVVAADGRNSTVARLLGLAPAAARDRVAIQTHLPLPHGFGERVVLRFRPEGYCGAASVGAGELNVCLVSTAPKLAALKRWAEAEFRIAPHHPWRSIAPLARSPIVSREADLYFIGDAARVVEPFTGEGIFYALASGELAARHLQNPTSIADFAREHAALYRGRLWINQLAKAAVLHPRLGSALVSAMRLHPTALRLLTAKVVGG